jgi:hypothetical protein
MDFIKNVFELLKRNKEYPYYQAERRIDIFLNLFLEEILNHFLRSDTIKFLLPEFPLKKKNNNQSTKVDYICYDQIKKVIYFVELKTDSRSFNPDQLAIYQEYNDWAKCLSEVQIISGKASKQYKSKFQIAFEVLKQANIFEVDAQDIPIMLIYMAPDSEKINETFTELEKLNKGQLISFSKLRTFQSLKYPAEWELFKDNFLL